MRLSVSDQKHLHFFTLRLCRREKVADLVEQKRVIELPALFRLSQHPWMSVL